MGCYRVHEVQLRPGEQGCQRRRAETNPQWQEVVQLLAKTEDVPGTKVELRLLRDKDNELLATALVPADQLLHTENLQVDGPFPFAGGQLHGSLRLKFSLEDP